MVSRAVPHLEIDARLHLWRPRNIRATFPGRRFLISVGSWHNSISPLAYTNINTEIFSTEFDLLASCSSRSHSVARL
jgi:hypothetical protein